MNNRAPFRIDIALALLFCGVATSAAAAQGVDLRELSRSAASSDGFLKPDQAFVLTAESNRADQVTLRWQIAKDYSLYRNKVKAVSHSAQAQPGAVELPAGKAKHDEYCGEQVVYYEELVANVPVSRAADLVALPLEVTYQGCAEAGLCYPPIRKQI